MGKSFIEKVTSKEFLRTAKSFFITLAVLAAIVIVYLYAGRMFNQHYLSDEAPKISDFKVIKNSVYSGKPVVAIYWKTSKPCSVSYDVYSSEESISYRGSKYTTEHTVVLSLNYFSAPYRIKVSSIDETGNEVVKNFNIRTSAEDKSAVGEVKVE